MKYKLFLIVAVSFVLAACGGIGNPTPVPAEMFPPVPEVTAWLGTDGSLLYTYSLKLNAGEAYTKVVENSSIPFEAWSANLMDAIPEGKGIEYLPGTFALDEGKVVFKLQEDKVTNLPEAYEVEVLTTGTSYLMVYYHREQTELTPNCGIVDSVWWNFKLQVFKDPGNPHLEYAWYSHTGAGTVGVNIQSSDTEVYQNPCLGVDVSTTIFPVK